MRTCSRAAATSIGRAGCAGAKRQRTSASVVAARVRMRISLIAQREEICLRAVAKALVLLAVAGCWSVPAQRAADLWSLPEAVVQNLSGARARAHVVELSRFYREDAT